MYNFTKEEIKTAKAVRKDLIASKQNTLKGIYMAGEICMWDENKKYIDELEVKVKALDEENKKLKESYCERNSNILCDMCKENKPIICPNCNSGDVHFYQGGEKGCEECNHKWL